MHGPSYNIKSNVLATFSFSNIMANADKIQANAASHLGDSVTSNVIITK
jgi:hypothetical protein